MKYSDYEDYDDSDDLEQDGSHHEQQQAEADYNRFEDTFDKFDLTSNNYDISVIVNSLLDRHYAKNFTPEVLRHIHGCIDLTTLNANDSNESVRAWVEDNVNAFDGKYSDVNNVAAICTYPLFVEAVKETLTAANIKICAVTGGFPASQTFTEVKIAETAMAVLEGAEEIDTVMNLGYFFDEDYETLSDELIEIKDSCRGATMKVILETTALLTTENVRKAAILALYSGADFIKTSTGKFPANNTTALRLEDAVYVMCKVIKEYASKTGHKAGIKIAGGIKTAEDAVKFYTIVKETLGKEWTSKELFRIGASSLHKDIEQRYG
ncbi:MAG: deoxyribose-phosphate aldolase [Tannerella sp.]|jgi:deoxyribose-phosphate aldolase|nr:deoxyribose-phosphate aldolase [Tannerella sp.]